MLKYLSCMKKLHDSCISNKGNMSDDYLLQEIRTGSSHNMLLSASMLLLITAVGKILNICNYSIVTMHICISL